MFTLRFNRVRPNTLTVASEAEAEAEEEEEEDEEEESEATPASLVPLLSTHAPLSLPGMMSVLPMGSKMSGKCWNQVECGSKR